MAVKKVFTTEEKIKIIKLTETKTRRELAKEYGCTMQSIALWKQLYDGTKKSLETSKASDEKAPKEAIEKIENLLKRNPYLNSRDIKMALGSYKYARTIKEYVTNLNAKDVPYKYKNATQVNSVDVDLLNERDLIGKRIPAPFYLIEVNDMQIYLSKENLEETSKFTAFYTSALRFETKKQAEEFMKEITVKGSRYKLSVREVKEINVL